LTLLSVDFAGIIRYKLLMSLCDKNTLPRLGILLTFLSGAASFLEAKAYWEGNQLNNQSRLGQPFNGFETEDPKEKRDAAQQAYDAQVRAQRVGRDGGKQNGTLIDLSGNTVDSFLTISRLEGGGRRFTLKLQVLFEENTAQYRLGSIGQLDRLNALLQSANDHIQLVFIDTAGDMPSVRELHIERAAMVTAYLALPSES